MSRVQAKEVIEMSKGTIYEVPGFKELLDEIDTVMAAGQFTESEDEVDLSQEEIIGEMTPFEKALYQLRQQKKSEARGMCQKCTPVANENPCKKVTKLHYESLCLNQMLWSAINLRLGTLKEYVGIRHGFKIVKFPSEKGEPRDPLSIFLHRLLSQD